MAEKIGHTVEIGTSIAIELSFDAYRDDHNEEYCITDVYLDDGEELPAFITEQALRRHIELEVADQESAISKRVQDACGAFDYGLKSMFSEYYESLGIKTGEAA
jgi:hypothetical protein